jgi:hypothetical protein
MNRRYGFYWIWGLATAAIATIVGLIAYHAGQTTQIVTTTAPDGRVFYPGYYGFGFFPFFGLFWILLIGFLFFRFVFWRPWGRGWGGSHYHDHTHSPAPTTPPAPPATRPDEPTIA